LNTQYPSIIKHSPTLAPCPPIKNISEYSQSIKEFINSEITIPKAMKINNWGKKYKSYASVVGTPTPDNTENQNK